MTAQGPLAASVGEQRGEVDRGPVPSHGTPVTGLDLDSIEAQANAATPGPWWITSTTACQIRNAFTPSLARVDRPGDATFITTARADVPALVAEVRRLTAVLRVVEDIHRRVPIYYITDDCANPAAHETAWVEDVNNWGEYLCPRCDPYGWTCAECGSDDPDETGWPCSTAQALAASTVSRSGSPE